MKSVNKSISKRSKWLILAGFAFFINPVPLGLDFIPDVFGCILLYFGLTQLSYFDGAIEKARKCILYLMAVEAIRLLMMKSVFLTEISSNRMLAVTLFTIVEGILYIVIFRQLFGGISYFSMRNNCNKTLAKTDGSAFLSYLSFMVRLAATLLPELLAILELEKEFATDFETIDSITDIMSAKPIMVALLSLIALVTSIAWYISTVGLFGSLTAEAGDDIDRRYTEEYSARPEKVRPKKLRNASFILYTAFLFAADIVFDGIRIIPASAMFLLLFIACFALDGIGDFSGTKKHSIPAFILLLCAEVYRAIYMSKGAVVIYETELQTVITALVISLITIPMCMLCVRTFLLEVRKLSLTLGGSDISITSAWVAYCVTTILWTLGYVIPYFYSYVSTLRFFAACVFIWQAAKIIVFINDEEYERASLYGKQ